MMNRTRSCFTWDILILMSVFFIGAVLLYTPPEAWTEETMPYLDQSKIIQQRSILCEAGAAIRRSYEPDPETGLYYTEVKIRSRTHFIGSHRQDGYFLIGWFSLAGDGKVSESGTREYFLEKYPNICDMIDEILSTQETKNKE